MRQVFLWNWLLLIFALFVLLIPTMTFPWSFHLRDGELLWKLKPGITQEWKRGRLHVVCLKYLFLEVAIIAENLLESFLGHNARLTERSAHRMEQIGIPYFRLIHDIWYLCHLHLFSHFLISRVLGGWSLVKSRLYRQLVFFRSNKLFILNPNLRFSFLCVWSFTFEV